MGLVIKKNKKFQEIYIQLKSYFWEFRLLLDVNLFVSPYFRCVKNLNLKVRIVLK